MESELERDLKKINALFDNDFREIYDSLDDDTRDKLDFNFGNRIELPHELDQEMAELERLDLEMKTIYKVQGSKKPEIEANGNTKKPQAKQRQKEKVTKLDDFPLITNINFSKLKPKQLDLLYSKAQLEHQYELEDASMKDRSK